MRIYLLNTLAVALLMVVSFSGCKKEAKDKNTKVANTPPPIKKIDTVTVKKIAEQPVKPDTVKAVNTKEAEAIKLDNNLVKEEFYVIGGSFKEIQRAKKFEKLLKAKGYEATVLKPHKGFNRVAIRAYKGEVKARAELKSLRKIFNDVSFWLLLPS